MKLKKAIQLLSIATFFCQFTNAQNLQFNVNNFSKKQLVMPDGYVVNYKAYENIFYVENVEDSVYQTLNLYIPDNAKDNTPIFLRTYIGGYMASKAKQPSALDASGRALEEGYVVCIPGSRGSNSFVHNDMYVSKKRKTAKRKNFLTNFRPFIRANCQQDC